MNRMARWMAASVVWLGLMAGARAQVVVASLNPLATDLLRQVGGERVEIVELMKPGQDPHLYQPTPDDLRRAANARLFVVMGKGLETYLDNLRDGLAANQSVFEIGHRLPSLQLNRQEALFACCPTHAHGAIDPHWWHDPKQMQRAARETARALSALDPEHGREYAARASAYADRLEEMRRWAAVEIARIPPADRKLTTAHAAFNYFCRAFGFTPVPVKGLTTRETESPEHLAFVIETLRRERVPAVFPERAAQVKPLEILVREAGVRLGKPLLAGTPDPSDPTYEAMFRHNVKSIVDALARDGER